MLVEVEGRRGFVTRLFIWVPEILYRCVHSSRQLFMDAQREVRSSGPGVTGSYELAGYEEPNFAFLKEQQTLLTPKLVLQT